MTPGTTSGAAASRVAGPMLPPSTAQLSRAGRCCHPGGCPVPAPRLQRARAAPWGAWGLGAVGPGLGFGWARGLRAPGVVGTIARSRCQRHSLLGVQRWPRDEGALLRARGVPSRDRCLWGCSGEGRPGLGGPAVGAVPALGLPPARGKQEPWGGRLSPLIWLPAEPGGSQEWVPPAPSPTLPDAPRPGRSAYKGVRASASCSSPARLHVAPTGAGWVLWWWVLGQAMGWRVLGRAVGVGAGGGCWGRQRVAGPAPRHPAPAAPPLQGRERMGPAAFLGLCLLGCLALHPSLQGEPPARTLPSAVALRARYPPTPRGTPPPPALLPTLPSSPPGPEMGIPETQGLGLSLPKWG